MTEDPLTKYHIRKYRDADRQQVRSICFETGLFGRPVKSRYGDLESFADMFTSYYTDCEPENAWVVARNDDDRLIVGYLLGCMDSRRAWDPTMIGVKHVLKRGLLFRPSTAPFYFRLLCDIVRDGGVHRTPIDFDKYPAHDHIDLLPEARGAFGKLLFEKFLEEMLAKGVRGAHGEGVFENTRIRRFAAFYGYKEIGEPYPIPGMRDLDGSRIHGITVVRDLTVPYEIPKPTPRPAQDATARPEPSDERR